MVPSTSVSEEATNGQIEEEEEEEDEEGGIRIGDIYVPPPPPASCTFDPTGPRLMISRIENLNFKSYAGKRVIGPFHKNFTAIVGPNGSGKSNVIDSLLFVFGYRAQKIRSKKVGVLIHNSTNNTDLDSCSVHVYFQKIIDTDENNYEVVPNSEFVVGRTAHRDNSSYYTVNGRRCTFKEANRVLRSFGIDLDHNRFLILQGEVEQIALMKPKAQTEHDQGMLEFLEDIVGSSRYKEPIELLSQRIEKLTEERADKLNRVKLVEKDMEELQGDRDEAIEFLKIENEMTLIQNRLVQLYRQKEKEAEEAAQKNVEEARQLLGEVEKELKGREEGKQEQVAKVKKLVKECDKKEKELEGKKQEYLELERKDLQCRETIKYTKANGKKLEKALVAERQKMEELESQPTKFEEEIEALKAKKDKLEAEKVAAEEKLAQVMASLKTETMELQEEKAVHEQELLGLQKGVNDTKSKYDIAQKELDLYVSTEKKATAKLHEIETNLETVTRSLEEKAGALSRLERLVPEKEGQLRDLEADLQQAITEEREAQEKLKAERSRVEELRSNANANRSRSRVLDSLLQAKRSGELPGIVGRLGDLGAIDEKYDVAISTACGQLDYIVTDTVLSAQRCVEYLKKHDVGVANFLALEKMDRWISYTTKKITTPENVPRLFDLVSVKEPSILPAFYFALRDTLVAKDLEQATRIGLQGRTRHRVVTLQGELIDVSGTMSGGGGRVSRGKMGKALLDESVGADDLDALVQQLGALESKCRQLQERKGILEDKGTALRKDVASSRLALQKFQVEVKGLKSQQSSLSTQLTEQRQKVQQAAPDSGHLAKLEKSAGAFKKEYDKTLSAWKKVEDKVLHLHEKIMEITSSRMGSVQQKVDGISNQMDAASFAITRASTSIKTAERNLKKCKDKIASLEAEIVETKESSEAAKKEYKDLETQGQELTEIVNKLTEELKTLKQHVAEMTAEMDSGNAEENALRSKQIELKNKLELSETALKECRGKVALWNKEMKNLKLHEIDDEPPVELTEFSSEELATFDEKNLSLQKSLLDDKHSSLKPNMTAISEYRRKEEVFKQRAAELEEVTEKRADQRKHHDTLRKERLNEFMRGFCIITAKLKETYQMLTLGGDAELELVDSLDPFSEGIIFSVRPPKKSWKNISNLSGGEKTLSSLALVFALHYYKPTPFYVMDEIDAALDIKNVSIVGHYVKERTRNAQFIIISLRNNMFELADRLVGIFKVDNCTDSCTINPRSLV
ncbi:structural maintenance of chromosomes protein 4 [Ixodes scapularis]|uniref:structural maintenance of chromosomes protein 4 n=1 Tax=Ixodes scapularis TaxID=6945 RepID=UPI001A9D9AAD|nr:structural maintenance of chromosomes protein 4 [Ixodes scapularis]